MKTLNLNKLTILLGLFLVSAFFTTGANAACVLNTDGEIKTTYGDSNGRPVTDTIGDSDNAAGVQVDYCKVTPASYKLVFYKYGLCKADPDLGDLSSCAFLFEEAAGVEHDIELGNTESLAIPEFAIEPGIYPFSYVSLSNKLGMKWSAIMEDSTQGETSGGTVSRGKSCWTSGRGPTSAAYQGDDGALVATVHGNTLTDGVVTIHCAATMGTPLFNYEILTRFSEAYCSADLAANGDKQTLEIEGVGQGRGIPTVSLLTTADAFATTCQTAAKIAWTTDLTTPITITENSTYEMMMKATDANSMLWNSSVSDDIYKIESGAPRLMLKVTN